MDFNEYAEKSNKIYYGKPYGPTLQFKTSFETENDKHLENANRIMNIYKMQPRREVCKICKHPLHTAENKLLTFKSHGGGYTICKTCGHLNGEYEETVEFSRKIYEDDDYGEEYRNIDKEEYSARTQNIYMPKAKHLIESLYEINEDPFRFSYLDIGAGSGYFVKALKDLGVDASGFEISEKQVAYGRNFLSEKILNRIESFDMPKKIFEAKQEVISFIGVLEHIINLDEIFDAIKENKNIHYIYFSVPMFSYSIMFESVFDSVFNRNLGGAHTHLFSNGSIEYLCKKYSWEIVSQWRFGTDIPDLIRSISVLMDKNGNSMLSDFFKKKAISVMDDLQLVIDKSGLCSEIHILVKKTV